MEANTNQILNQVIRLIVEAAQPDKIILFGSMARNENGAGSDLDLMVIKSGKYHRGHLTEELYMRLFGVGHPVDLVVATPEDVEQYRDSPGLVFHAALREGKVVYAV